MQTCESQNAVRSQAVAGALDGVRVLDLSRILAGPYCTMLLGDPGADVNKVERPGTGDDTRAWGPPFAGGESAYYLCANRNKRSITVNLKSETGRSVIRRLAGISDVLVENYKVGELAALGLSYERLNTINPRLIYCSITGYGQTGPPLKLSDTPVAYRLPPPLLGEHTDSVLSTLLGYTSDEVARLRADGAV